MELKMVDRIFLGASHWSCGCLNTYHPRFECPSMSESERAEHKARSLGNPLFIGYDPASRGGDHSALAVLLTAGEPLYEECLATQDADDPTDIVPLKKGDPGSVYGDESRDSVIDFDETMTRAMVAAGYVAMRDSTELNDDEAAVVVYRAMRALEPEAKPGKGDDVTLVDQLSTAFQRFFVLRQGISKANTEIMRRRDELARRPAAFVELESDKPNPFRDFTTDRRRMGPL